ncbi:MAG: sigma-70 family RNA polymerase sigma factor [Victivallaceae bacterium]|nr:sigma-70 family RNA polymerase sigma factor [Victivallaceae bacterium]MDD3116194.1 sigma-70 family RNA polymerase sigma factor [Victivallaceae bacterium]MDD3702618.1 sigma-70 family RNA polymerase sigma factor [Victivallaceae bacterium]MDD4317669.1 sigma-70 family RNA polymerase sigma factor [Victivallaceae bacterium]
MTKTDKIDIRSIRKKNTANDNPMTISQAYMRNIVDYSLLTQDEEIKLAEEIKSSDPHIHEEARAKLIKSNLRLVVKIAGEFLNRGVSKHDLIAEGNIGLMIAAEKFDPAKGAKFSTYSTWWIKQHMRRAIATQSRTIRIPVQSIEKIAKINRAEKMFMQENDRMPNDDEIAELTDLSIQTINKLRHVGISTASLNDLIRDGESDELIDLIADTIIKSPDSILDETDFMAALHKMIDSLSSREKEVLTLRYGLYGHQPMTLEEVGSAIGCTRERVRQIQHKAIVRLQEEITAHDLGKSSSLPSKKE